jgi:hypothetical protein
MDIIDNLMYATYGSPLEVARAVASPPLPPTVDPVTLGNRIISNYIPSFANPAIPIANIGLLGDPVFSFNITDKMKFCAYQDPDVVEDTILRHWHDINMRRNYDQSGVTPSGTVASGDRYSSFEVSSTYHMIFAYLTENTRMLQIFERMLEKYLHDEEFGIANDPLAFNWIQNSERLFFKNDSLRSSNIRSLVRPNAEASRRNAYWRMFGMDLAFGDINSHGGGSAPYYKAKVTNQQFIPLFERYLTEVWQAFINARNTSGMNTSDIDALKSLAIDLRELLIARRGDPATRYVNLNLSREEFSSVLMTSWFMLAITDNTPIVQFLKCDSSTIGDRLINIGNKVGIPAHSKSQALFEIAAAASNILRKIEDQGILDNQTRMRAILSSLDPNAPGSDPDVNIMTDLLTIINYWEKATGHRIKNPEANIRGTVKVQQNGVSSNGVKSQPALN